MVSLTDLKILDKKIKEILKTNNEAEIQSWLENTNMLKELDKCKCIIAKILAKD